MKNGRVVGSVVVFKDITERKQVSGFPGPGKLPNSPGLTLNWKQFAFVASHDLQEHIFTAAKFRLSGDRLKVKCEPIQAPDIQDYLDRMQSAAARMRNLINDLLAFSRVIRSSEPFVPVDLAVVTKEVLGDLEVRIEKSGAKVEIENLSTIDADSMQMRQLMLNLLSNALKFQLPGAKPLIKISSTTSTPLSREPQCEIRVEDNGIGFDEKYMDKIFAVFQRLHGRTEFEGTGVGLAVCRRIVDRHHGAITARSQPGKGATFIVTLPIKQAAPQVNSDESLAKTTNVILMADDDDDDRLLTRDAVAEAGLDGDLHFVQNGEELLDYLCRRGWQRLSLPRWRPGQV